MLALDLDGTALRSDQTVSDKTISRLHKLQQRGIKIVLATGRMKSSTIEVAKSMPKLSGLVCCNGAYVFDKEAKVDARVISLTENLVRLDNTQKELIDRCTALYKQYGNMAIVAQETGLRPSVVSQYVKYDQLIPLLKQKVDAVQLDMKVALQAQKAATASNGEVDEEAAAKFAEELAPMSNLQRKTFVESVTADPTASLEERIEKGKRSRTLKMITVTLEESLHKGLQDYAKGSECSQDEAAADLIEDGLTRRGLLTKE